MGPSASTAEPVSLQFEPTCGEFTAALRTVIRRRRWIRLLFGLGTLMVAVGVLATASGGDDGGWTAWGVLLEAYLALIYFGCPLLAWRRESEYRGSRTFAFDAESVTCTTGLTATRLRWAFYSELVETADAHLLIRGGRACTTIPKRAFASPADQDRFRTLAREGITTRA